jgi:hypothetical protein
MVYDYWQSLCLEAEDASFTALIMAAIRKADTVNLGRLKMMFPDIWTEFERRYYAPGGFLPEDGPDHERLVEEKRSFFAIRRTGP